ncbi:MAG: ABC transporter permease subunit [Anaerolineae bacterium]|nr:ABC transporter permease subunit [Anaerolineae bacterium]
MMITAKTGDGAHISIASVIRWVIVAAFDVALGWVILQLIGDGSYPLAMILTAVLIIVTVSNSLERFKPYRWLAIGLSLATLFTLYPILYTFYLATTNTGSGHVLTKQQAIDFLQREQYVPKEGKTFKWTAFQTSDGQYALWLVASDGKHYFAKVGEALTEATSGSNGIGELDEQGVPVNIDGYKRLQRRDIIVILDALSKLEFGTAPEIVRISSISSAATTQQRYMFDAQQDAIIDQQTGAVYRADAGTFASESETLTPGYFVSVGADNFNRFFSSSALRGPLATIITWNFTYAILSVLVSFSLGLAIALLFDNLPGKRIIRTLLIVPYPIPALVSILIWRNLLNPDFGALVKLLESLFGASPRWLTDPTATRAAIIIINMWLSYPYFYIVTSGALQAIPTDMLDAAAVDGANVWQKFRHITLPLLLQIVSPLLVASFAFNFNNFNLIYIFNQGNPPIAGSPIPAGSTDILISFVYRLAFNTAQSDYGLAAAISIVLFVFVAAITWMQFRYTRLLEDRT